MVRSCVCAFNFFSAPLDHPRQNVEIKNTVKFGVSGPDAPLKVKLGTKHHKFTVACHISPVIDDKYGRGAPINLK